jgi:hypothetical protein
MNKSASYQQWAGSYAMAAILCEKYPAHATHRALSTLKNPTSYTIICTCGEKLLVTFDEFAKFITKRRQP